MHPADELGNGRILKHVEHAVGPQHQVLVLLRVDFEGGQHRRRRQRLATVLVLSYTNIGT